MSRPQIRNWIFHALPSSPCVDNDAIHIDKHTYARTQHTSTNQRRCVSLFIPFTHAVHGPSSSLMQSLLISSTPEKRKPSTTTEYNVQPSGITIFEYTLFSVPIHRWCRGSHTEASMQTTSKYTQSQSTVEISIHNTCRAYKRPSKSNERLSLQEKKLLCVKHRLEDATVLFFRLIKTNFHIEIHAFETRECFYASSRLNAKSTTLATIQFNAAQRWNTKRWHASTQ